MPAAAAPRPPTGAMGPVRRGAGLRPTCLDMSLPLGKALPLAASLCLVSSGLGYKLVFFFFSFYLQNTHKSISDENSVMFSFPLLHFATVCQYWLPVLFEATLKKKKKVLPEL